MVLTRAVLLTFLSGCSCGPISFTADADPDGDASPSADGSLTVDGSVLGPGSCSGGAMPECAFAEPMGEVVALAADPDRLYWTELGTFDGLGNYNNDGRLVSRPLGGGPLAVHLDALEHPSQVEVTRAHFYISEFHFATGARTFSRYSIATGEGEELGPWPRHLDSDHDVAVWVDADNVVWAAGEGPKFVIHRREHVETIVLAGTHAYISTQLSLRRVSLLEGDEPVPELLSTVLSQRRSLAWSGTALYSFEQSSRLEPTNATYLTDVSIDGEIRRVALVTGAAPSNSRLRVIGDRYLVALYSGLVAGRIRPEGAGRTIATDVRVSVATDLAVFWFDGTRIIRTAWPD